jgi:hypothetical protein
MKGVGWVLAAVAFGCVHTPPPVRTEHVLTGAAYPAHDGPVRIVMEGSPAATNYEEVAVVNATGVNGNATLGAVLAALQKEAAALGCDAVLRVRYDQGQQMASATGVAVRTK